MIGVPEDGHALNTCVSIVKFIFSRLDQCKINTNSNQALQRGWERPNLPIIVYWLHPLRGKDCVITFDLGQWCLRMNVVSG